jgi:hypothetical protein
LEWNLVCLAYNLKRLHIVGATPKPAGTKAKPVLITSKPRVQATRDHEKEPHRNMRPHFKKIEAQNLKRAS